MKEIEIDLFKSFLVNSAYVVTLFTLLPLIFGVLKWRLLDKPLKVFFLYCLITLTLNIIENLFIWSVRYEGTKDVMVPFIKKWGISNTNFFSVFYFTKNFILLGLFFKLSLKHSKNIKWINPLIIILLTAIWVNYIFIEGYKVYSFFNHTIDSIFCFLFPLYFFWFIFNEDSKVPLGKNPYFWICMGLISTSLIAFYLFLTGEKINSTDKVLFYKLSIVKNIVMMIEQILEAIGFYYARYAKYLSQNKT